MEATERDQRPGCRVPLADRRRDYAEGSSSTPARALLLAMVGGHLAAVGLGPAACSVLTGAAWMGGLLLRRRPWAGLLWAVAFGSLLPGMAVVQGDAARIESMRIDGVITGRILRAEPESAPRMLEVEVLNHDGIDARPRVVRLQIYTPLDITTGQVWHLPVRLRAPRGPANPGTGDPDRNLFRAGIDGQGYVRGEGARLLADAPPRAMSSRLRTAGSARIDAVAPGVGGRHLRALLVGDRRALQGTDWALLAATGTTHLLVVSGLHVGMVAALAFGLASASGLRGWSPGASTLLVLAAAGSYALVTGFELPARRAWIMLAVGAALMAGQRLPDPGLALLWAALAILVLDPLAPLAAGFWLSFLAVAALLVVISGRSQGGLSGLRGLLLTQLTVATILAVPLAVVFGRMPVLAPLVNLLAIPMVSMLLLPLGLLLLIALSLGVPGAGAAMGMLALVLEWCLLALAALPNAAVALSPAATVLLPLAVVAAAAVWMPWPWPLRAIAGCLLLALLVPRLNAPAEGTFRLHLLDVGQGKAAIVRTRHHVLLYDTGPPFGPDSDAGMRIVVPALRALGVTRLDRVVISHDHADHSGGLGSVRSAFPDAVVSAPTPLPDADLCHAGQSWEWDDVRFDLLLPEPGVAGEPRFFNRHSCVLRVRAGARAVLLPGDIDVFAERRLAADLGPKDVVVAAHHGSHTSSGRVLVRLTQPRFVWVAAGCPSPFGHPHPVVVERWQAAGARVRGTGPGGMLTWNSAAPTVMSAERERRRRYWHWSAADGVEAEGCRVADGH